MNTRNSKRKNHSISNNSNNSNNPPPEDEDDNYEYYDNDENDSDYEDDYDEREKFLDEKDVSFLRKIKKSKKNLYNRFVNCKKIISSREITLSDILTCENITEDKRANLLEKLECIRQLEPCTEDYIQSRDQLRSMFIKYSIIDNVNVPPLHLNIGKVKSPILQPINTHEADASTFKRKIQDLVCSESNRKILEEKLDEFEECKGEEKNKVKRWLSNSLTLPYDKITPPLKTDAEINQKIKETQEYLNKKLYGMKNVKERLVLFLNKKLREANTRGCNIALLGKPGVGKCLHPDTEIIMYDLSIKRAKDIVEGDLLLGDDQSPRLVMSTVKGREEMFSIDQEYGETYIVNRSHILTLRERSSDNIVDVPLVDVLGKESQYIPVSARYFSKEDCEIDAKELGKSMTCQVADLKMPPFLPHNYITWSRKLKANFLEGLIKGCQLDTERNETNNPHMRDDEIRIFIPADRRIKVRAILHLLRSTGLRCRYEKPYLVILKNNDNDNISIRSLGEGDYCGFMIDGNERFVLADWTVTHNTAIAKSLAECLGLPFAQVSFGGVTHPDFLMGHDYTYIGSRPGEISRCLSRMGTKNGILFFDEFDKATDKKEIMSTLLHVTDFSQNSEFRDNYFPELTQDLSKIWFIYSMNQLPTDPAMLDRLEIIHVDEYTIEERKAICIEYLFPKYLKELKIQDQVVVTEEGVRKIIEIANGTKDRKGVRDLERSINLIIEKIYFYLNNKDIPEYEEEYPWYKKIVGCLTKDGKVAISKQLCDTILHHCKKDEVYVNMYM